MRSPTDKGTSVQAYLDGSSVNSDVFAVFHALQVRPTVFPDSVCYAMHLMLALLEALTASNIPAGCCEKHSVFAQPSWHG